MRWFRRNKEVDIDDKESSKLEYPDLSNFEQWVEILIKAFDLKEGEFTFVGCYGGILLYIKSQGLIWMPYSHVKEVLKKIEGQDIIHPTTVLSGMAIATVAHVSILPLVIADRGVRGFYRIYSKQPPKKMQSYLLKTIDKIVVSKVKTRPLSKIHLSSPHTSKTSEYGIELSIHQKFIDEVELNTIEKFSDMLKTIVFGGSSSLFSLPYRPDLHYLLNAIREEGVEVIEKDVTFDNALLTNNQ